jgi:N-acetylglutamate synthase-like GNAT family acetyltransferase
VGTVPEERGKLHARQLLYWIGERLTQDGIEVRLYARPHRVSYYEEIGFKECGIDTVLERIDTNE